jgi:hypothetical protein
MTASWSSTAAAAATVATTLPTTVAAAARTASRSSATTFTRLGFVDRERKAIQFFAIESADSGQSLFTVRHFYKAKSTGFPGVSVCNDLGRTHFAKRFKKLLQSLFCGLKRQIPYVNIHKNPSLSERNAGN